MRKYIATLALLTGLAGGTVNAASLSTDVTVNLGSAISFYCFDEVDVVLSADTYLSAITRNGTRPMPSITRNARARPGRLIVNGRKRVWNRGRFRFRPRVNLDLLNVCAYRAMGSATGARVKVERLENVLEAAGGGSIKVDRVRTRDTDKAGRWRRQYRIRQNELGVGVVRGIDVRLRLDIRNATEPGQYSSPVDGTFRVTLISNP